MTGNAGSKNGFFDVPMFSNGSGGRHSQHHSSSPRSQCCGSTLGKGKKHPVLMQKERKLAKRTDK